MRHYKLLVLGRHTDDKTLDIRDITECWHQMTISLVEGFNRLDHVETHFAQIHHPRRDGYDYRLLPKVDMVLFCGLTTTWEQIDFAKLRQATGFKKVISYLEGAMKGADWAFSFREGGNPGQHSTFIPTPIEKKLYKNVPKEPKTILLDHCMCETSPCWLHCIEAWLSTFQKHYKIYRLRQSRLEKATKMKPYIIPIDETTFLQYLKATDKIETYIVTHPESYGFSNLDMLARGIRVLTPPDFLNKKAFEIFHLPTFRNIFECHQQIKTPIDTTYWNNQIDKMTDYSKIIELIDKKMRQFLLKDDIIQGIGELKLLKNEVEETKG